jgi:hypothetical protein
VDDMAFADHLAPGARELFPDVLAKFPSGAFLCFLFFVLEAV